MSDSAERLIAALADRYRIERELGAGGMATVYLAQDLKHDRKVAIKVLRPELAAVIGAERFLREIKTIASLQHPHILGLIDSGEVQGTAYYVMPFVEGESLRDRLNREKQLPINEAVRLATEVAAALDYAHRHGVIHRDIKPENIMLHDGSALVADFGIALAISAAGGGSRITETGMSLGTPHYMSPEQAMGQREISARSDVYALGAATYEMLIGEPPFTGSTAQAIVARMMTESPRSLVAQRGSIPAHVEAAVLAALEKLPADRFGTTAEFAIALSTRRSDLTTTRAVRPGLPRELAARPRTRLRDPVLLATATVALVALAAAAAAMSALARRPLAVAAVPPIRFVVTPGDSAQPVNTHLAWPAAISPDGSMVVYSVALPSRETQLYLQRTDQLQGHPIPGTVNGYMPYFSPDGRSLGFEVHGKSMKVRLDGSDPVVLADDGRANGADWLVGDQIVLGGQGTFHGLSRVSAAGGVPQRLTEPDTARGELEHVWPIALPDGSGVVFTVWSGSLGGSRLALASLDGQLTPLGILGIRPLAVVDGMLVFLQADGEVMAVPFDLAGRRVRGKPIPVHNPVPVDPDNNGNSGIYISRGGALVTVRGGGGGMLRVIGVGGRTEWTLPEVHGFSSPRFSPDGRQIAAVVRDGARADVWIYHQTLGTFSRLTTRGTVTSVEWSADGLRVLYAAAGENGRSALWLQSVNGGQAAERLFESGYLVPYGRMAPDEKSALVSLLSGYWNLHRVILDSAPASVVPFTSGTGNIAKPAFSPDGGWVAMSSDESGRRTEVFIRSYPNPATVIQVSVDGGGDPVWSRDGRSVYYRAGSALLAARLALAPTLSLTSRDTVLANFPLMPTLGWSATYDVSSDGKHFLGVAASTADFELVVSPNWITELRLRVAESRP